MGRNSSGTYRRGGRAAILAAAVALCATSVVSALGATFRVKPGGKAPLAGLQDDRLLQTDDAAGRLKIMADAGASLTRVDLRWDLVALRRPANATDPADPAYDWTRYDRIVDAAAANTVQVLFAVYGTPQWAVKPSELGTGVKEYPYWSHRPENAADFGAFAEAAAKRYAPKGVHLWEGWNEPNIALFLQPQYERQGGEWVAVSPAIYAGLLKAFYSGIKKADPTAVVAGAVTAPVGDRCDLYECSADAAPLRVYPPDFVAALNASALRPPMDAVSHHPYPLRGPADFTPRGRVYVDLYNLGEFTAAVDRTYLKGKKLWLTEYGFATAVTSQYKTAFTRAKQAEHISDAYRRMRTNARVALSVYYLVQDHSDWASGILTQSGGRKPGYTAFAFPLAATPNTPVAAGSLVTIRGQVRNATRGTAVTLQQRNGSRWIPVKSFLTAADGSFALTVRPTAKLTVRARWTGVTRSGARVTRISPAVAIQVR